MKFIFILVMVMVYQVFGWKENRIKRMPQHANYTPVTNDVAMRYLTHFGYVNPPKDTAIASLQNVSQRNLEIPLEIVIRSFQEFNNLPITGELDEATKTFMASPRCGIKDNIKNLRFNIPMPWKNQKITYAVLNTSPYLALVDFRKVIRKAFDIWSSVIPRDFEETELKNSADIKIKFLTGVHGDHPDGASENYKNQNVLAHAGVQVFSNSNSHGFVHFDTEQNWKIYKTGDKVSFLTHDVLLVAIHEIGHALGLDHTKVKNAIMFSRCSIYSVIDANGNYVEPKLLSTDIVDMQEIYGSRQTPPTKSTSQQNKPKEGTKKCSTPLKDKSIIGSIIATKNGQLNECCGFCSTTNGCKAYSWKNKNGGECYLKNSVGPIFEEKNTYVGLPTETSVPVFQRNSHIDGCAGPYSNKNIKFNDIHKRRGTLEECGKFCGGTAKCVAFAWDEWEGGTCWLKSSIGPAVDDVGVYVGICGCRDFNPEKCKELAQKGECSKNTVKLECLLSCGFCGNETCYNKHSHCEQWRAAGECTKNPTFMHLKCPWSCKTCKPCSDNHASCKGWATIGECEKNPKYMLPNCAKSCKKCETAIFA